MRELTMSLVRASRRPSPKRTEGVKLCDPQPALIKVLRFSSAMVVTAMLNGGDWPCKRLQ